MGNNTDGELGKIIAKKGVSPVDKTECEQAEEAKEDGIQQYDKAKDARRSDGAKSKFEDKARAIAGAFVKTTNELFDNMVVKMISCHSASASFNSEFVAGQKKGTIEMCNGKSYTFGQQRHTQFGCHAETKLISALAKVGLLKGAKISFNIFWKNSDGVSNIPCPSCFDAMCFAANECGAEISVCNEENEKITLDKEVDCKDKKRGYNTFCEKITL